ncbi:hypothetical protein [Flavobacterium tegetincola]|uniref:hypothetical protein n=1 Tax=Flavobacterium tegetincola TaxID=150172 RepID=UPI00047B5A27|nr:hypothetical protein [Flavobacterium tegetincola]
MSKFYKILSILLIIIFSGCRKNIDDMGLNEKVLSEILPAIVDSYCVDIRVYHNPPPKYGQLIFDKNGNYVRTDTTKATLVEIQKFKDWKSKLKEIEKDTSEIIIAFDPKILPFELEDAIIKDSYFTKDTLQERLTVDKRKPYVLKFEQITLNGKFKLKNINEFDKKNIFEVKYNFNFSGILTVSGIKFDKKRENGVLDVAFLCGRLCGYGGKVFIKNVNRKWRIIKMEETWIS